MSPEVDFAHELGLAEAPFQEQRLRAKAIGRQDLIDHFETRANLASDIKEVELSNGAKSEGTLSKITSLIVSSSIYRELPKSSVAFSTKAYTFDQYVHWYARPKPINYSLYFPDELGRAYNYMPSEPPVTPAPTLPLSKLQQNYTEYVQYYLGRSDDHADRALHYRESLAKQAVKRQAEAPAKLAERRRRDFANVLASTSNYIVAYPENVASITDPGTINHLRSAKKTPIMLAAGIITRETLKELCKQAHYELAAPLALDEITEENSHNNPWHQSKFLATATKVGEELTKNYYGKISGFEAVPQDVNDELLAQLFTNRTTEAPDLEKVRRILWQITLLPTGKPPIRSAVESVIYMHHYNGSVPKPTIKFLKNFERIGADNVASEKAASIATAQIVESNALQRPLQGGLPGLGKNK